MSQIFQRSIKRLCWNKKRKKQDRYQFTYFLPVLLYAGWYSATNKRMDWKWYCRGWRSSEAQNRLASFWGMLIFEEWILGKIWLKVCIAIAIFGEWWRHRGRFMVDSRQLIMIHFNQGMSSRTVLQSEVVCCWIFLMEKWT